MALITSDETDRSRNDTTSNMFPLDPREKLNVVVSSLSAQSAEQVSESSFVLQIESPHTSDGPVEPNGDDVGTKDGSSTSYLQV